MTGTLCIYWEANGGRGYSSRNTPDTPEGRHLLESWIRTLNPAYPQGRFEIVCEDNLRHGSYPAAAMHNKRFACHYEG